MSRFKNLIIKTSERGVSWMLRRLYQEILIPSTPFSEMINTIIFTPIRIKKKIFPNKNDTLYFVWDLRIAPITFDFFWGIAIANCQLQEKRLRKLHVIILYEIGRLREEEKDYSDAVTLKQRLARIENLLLSSCQIIKNINFSILSKSEAKQKLIKKIVFPTNYYVNFPTYISSKDYRILNNKNYNLDILKKEKKFINKAQKWLLIKNKKSTKTITISIRDYKFKPYRNSNFQEWSRVYKKLKELKYKVVIIPDSESETDLTKYFDNKDIYFESSNNLSLKIGCYFNSILNLFVDGGASTPCIFSSLPYIIFNIIPPESKEYSEKLLSDRNFKLNTSPSFLKKNQYWVWEQDKFDTIMNAINLFFKDNNLKTIIK